MNKATENKSKSGDPNPEVKPPKATPAKRRLHTAEYKLRVLREADALKGQHGAIGALLRREGLYSSLLAEWRGQRETGSLAAFSQARGRKAKFTASEVAIEKLQRENERLAKKLRQAELIIEAQKKISEILGITLDPTNSESKP